MSFLTSAFSIKKTKPRKNVSRSPLKLSADEMHRELGPKCEVVDVRITDKKIVFNTEHAEWNTDDAESLDNGASSSAAQELRKQTEVLQEENNMLKMKVEALLNLVAESIAELPTAQE